ncbi:hypothetical protein QQX98_005392 [Neonectria punicea]|uniref:Uncharacterized protein n=1 Tax=Neonectria punicea TaxID=979145 RepID=A0ABR1H574_9HYPO
MPPESSTTDVATKTMEELRMLILEYKRSECVQHRQKLSSGEARAKRMMANEELAKTRELLGEIKLILDRRSANNLDEIFSEFNEIVDGRQRARDEEHDRGASEADEELSLQDGIQSEEPLYYSKEETEGLALDDIEECADEMESEAPRKVEPDDLSTSRLETLSPISLDSVNRTPSGYSLAND